MDERFEQKKLFDTKCILSQMKEVFNYCVANENARLFNKKVHTHTHEDSHFGFCLSSY